MSGDYGTGGTMKFRLIVPASEDDCPNRTRFLKELAEKKGREPFTWREKLGYREPDSKNAHQR